MEYIRVKHNRERMQILCLMINYFSVFKWYFQKFKSFKRARELHQELLTKIKYIYIFYRRKVCMTYRAKFLRRPVDEIEDEDGNIVLIKHTWGYDYRNLRFARQAKVAGAQII